MKICCIVKPEAVLETDAIVQALARAGIDIIARKEIVYASPLIRTLYDHMPADAVREICRRMEGKAGVALLLEASSVEYLLVVAGRESDPARCAPGSIRAQFGKGAAEESVGSWPWWENVLHRPIDEREAARDLALIFGI